MLTKLKEAKGIRDAIHNYIHVEYQILWDCINAREFQRLRRIHQLGATFQVYPSAEHSRFTHSLGVYEIVRRMLNEVEDLGSLVKEEEKVLVLLAALLHDIGHGPFSHAFEIISGQRHEEMTQQILTSDSEIFEILNNYGKDIPHKLVQVLNHTYPNELLSQLISSQLDGDRMDYLLRDAYFTGVKYGNFDFERILRTMKAVKNKLLVKESGIPAVEDYIMARYHMYWQVYYHPVSRSFEAMVSLLFRRMVEVYNENPETLKEATMFLPYLRKEKVSNQDHYVLDESSCQYGFHLLSNCEDTILKDLAERLLKRDLFEFIDNINQKEEIQEKLVTNNYDLRYYYYEDQVRQRVYQPYHGNDTPIWVLSKKEEILELSAISSIVHAVTNSEEKIDDKIYFPKEIL